MQLRAEVKEIYFALMIDDGINRGLKEQSMN